MSFPAIWSSTTRREASLLAFVIVITAPTPAHAYLDPGSVSLTIQAIVAALAGAALTWKSWYWRLKSLLRREGKRKPGADDAGHSPRTSGGTDAPSGD